MGPSSSKNMNKKKFMNPKGGVAKNKAKETALKGACFHCGKNGHRRRNYKAYLESLKKKASYAPSTSGMFVIEVNIVSHDNL